MVQVLREHRPDTLKERAISALGTLGQEASQLIPQHLLGQQRAREEQRSLLDEEDAIRRITGLDVSGLSPELKRDLFKEQAKLIGKKEGGDQEKAASFQQGIETVQQMRDLLKKGDIGFFESLKVPFSPQARESRQQFNTLATSLIGLYGATLPTGIRNRTEFEEYMKGIPHSTKTKSSIEGALNALETLFKTGVIRNQVGPLGEIPEEVLQAEENAVTQLKQLVPEKKKKSLKEIFK